MNVKKIAELFMFLRALCVLCFQHKMSSPTFEVQNTANLLTPARLAPL